MRKLIWKIALIAGICAVCALAITPPEQKIRLGKDLRGGVSLIYHVRVDPKDTSPVDTLNQVISVIKERIDPKGLLDLSIQPLGNDRFEIVMPLPSATVRELRAAWEQAMSAMVREAQVSDGDLRQALDAGNAAERFGGADAARRAQLEDLQAAHDAMRSAAAELDRAAGSGADPAALRPLQQAAADTDLAFEQALSAVLRLNLEPSRIERALRLSAAERPVRDAAGLEVIDPATGRPQMSPSPRAAELGAIRSQFPHLAGRLDGIVAAYDAYAAQRKGFDDPEDLMRLMRGAGVLEFHIAVRSSEPLGVSPEDMREQLRERGPRETDSTVAAWLPINDLKQWYERPEDLGRLQADPVGYFAARDLVAGERDGQYYLLLYVTEPKSITHGQDSEWAVVRTYLTVDNFGRPAVGFELDAPGGRAMNRLTGLSLGQPMAIVLDGQVYSAPTIQSTIAERGQITGTFSQSELNYLTRVLAAGSLGAKLSPDPIAINTIGPTVGAENLEAGLRSFAVALAAVAVFMIGYYFLPGVIAVLALLANGLILFGVMAMIDGTFTLPGLAGVVLTMGMAVDANVLIYERMREELLTGEVDLRGAVRLSYARVFWTIFDSNATTLITAFVLYNTATTEVKGFALTLAIGLLASLFTSLFMTRVCFDLYTEVFGFRRLPMLATVWPGLRRLLQPEIRWMALRTVFITASSIAILASIGLCWARGVNMFDTEFRGGVTATMRTAIVDRDRDGEPDARDARGEPLRLCLPQTGPGGVETRLRAAAGALDPGADPGWRDRMVAALTAAGVVGPAQEHLEEARAVLREMARSPILTIGETAETDGRVCANAFQVKVASPEGLTEEQTVTDVVVTAITTALGDDLDVSRPLRFRGSGTTAHSTATFQVTRDTLGENIERPEHTQRVADFKGGVAVVLDEVDPPAQARDVTRRIERMRSQPDFAETVGREVAVFGLEPADPADPRKGYRSMAVVVYDPELSSYNADFDAWDRGLAASEWRLINEALRQASTLEQVSSFSSAIAETFKANAVVAVSLSLLAILVYVWVRFGSLRYSAGAVVCLFHDCTIALGFVALSAWLSRTGLGRALLIEEFRIDLNVVAAILTIIGFSINDTIVVMDRIRENRGKLPIPTATIVNRAINQTFSRTVLTSFTVFLSLLVMYVYGGSGIRPFCYCMLVGVIVGSYSTVAIAAPLVTARDRPGRPSPAGPAALQQEARREPAATAPA
jgi:SecD/SecF fusion protein